jgi:hypothetical protein
MTEIVFIPGRLPSGGQASGPGISTLPYFIGILGPPDSCKCDETQFLEPNH